MLPADATLTNGVGSFNVTLESWGNQTVADNGVSVLVLRRDRHGKCACHNRAQRNRYQGVVNGGRLIIDTGDLVVMGHTARCDEPVDRDPDHRRRTGPFGIAEPTPSSLAGQG